jgi:hypothetical protein
VPCNSILNLALFPFIPFIPIKILTLDYKILIITLWLSWRIDGFITLDVGWMHGWEGNFEGRITRILVRFEEKLVVVDLGWNVEQV